MTDAALGNSDTSTDDIDVLIIAGIPDMKMTSLDDGRPVYPGTATDTAKILREIGLRVGWQHEKPDRAIVEHKAADHWLPILVFAQEAVANGAGTLFAQAIITLLGKATAERSTLHVEFQRKRGNKTETFKASGPGKGVLEAMREFDQR